MIWSGDILSDPTWPSFELDRDFVKDITMSKFEVDSAENVASKSVYMVFLGFDLVTFLTIHDPPSNLAEILSRTSFWAILKLIRLEIWPLECSQGFFYDLI